MWMIDLENLDSLIILLNMVLSMKIGKYSLMKLIIFFMKMLEKIGVMVVGLVRSIVLSVVIGVNRIML